MRENHPGFPSYPPTTLFPRVRVFLRDGKLLTLMLGHLTVDSYAGVIPVLYPILIGRFRLSLATVGLVSLAYSGMAAVSQPLFGVLADRFGTRFTGDRKSTRLNSSHANISYAVFCLKKKKKIY